MTRSPTFGCVRRAGPASGRRGSNRRDHAIDGGARRAAAPVSPVVTPCRPASWRSPCLRLRRRDPRLSPPCLPHRVSSSVQTAPECFLALAAFSRAIARPSLHSRARARDPVFVISALSRSISRDVRRAALPRAQPLRAWRRRRVQAEPRRDLERRLRPRARQLVGWRERVGWKPNAALVTPSVVDAYVLSWS